MLGQAIVWVTGLRPGTRQSGVLRTRSVASVCRRWARDRAEIQAELRGGSMITGRMSAAYSDHVDVVSISAEPYAITYAALEVLTRTFD